MQYVKVSLSTVTMIVTIKFGLLASLLIKINLLFPDTMVFTFLCLFKIQWDYKFNLLFGKGWVIHNQEACATPLQKSNLSLNITRFLQQGDESPIQIWAIFLLYVKKGISNCLKVYIYNSFQSSKPSQTNASKNEIATPTTSSQ